MKKKKYRRNLRALDHNNKKTIGQKIEEKQPRVHRKEDVFISR